ncbi:MAG: hypothetical protein H6626_12890 [Pseudobdellovibrionaceae bacterium]|nr:MAG: hypothetical protein H6626_12890 [Pseudobdellovibrionaceae bacterium]
MKLRKQVVLTNEAWSVVEGLTKNANSDFKLGHITYSDTINAMIMNSKVSVEGLRSRHTDVRRTLKTWASKKEVDIDSLIKDLNEIKSKATKRRSISSKKEGM